MVEGCAHTAMANRHISQAYFQRAQVSINLPLNVRERHVWRACGGQFNCQRHSGDMLANPGDGRQRYIRNRNPRPDLCSALDKELHRTIVGKVSRGQHCRIRWIG